MSKIKKIGIILVSIFVVLVVLPISAIAVYQHDLKINHPEEYAKQMKEYEERKTQEMFERMDQKEKVAELAKQEALEKEFYEKNKVLMDLGIDPRDFKDYEIELGPELIDAERLQDQRRSGLISQSQECQQILALMNQNWNDDFAYSVWYDVFLQDCSEYDP